MPVLQSIFDTTQRFTLPAFRKDFSKGQRFEVDRPLLESPALNPQQIDPIRQQTIAPAPQSNPVTSQAIQPSTSVGTGGTGSFGITGAQSNVGAAGETRDFGSLTEQARKDAEQEGADNIAALQPTFAAVFEPIISDLDTQLGNIGGQRGELESLIGAGAAARGQGVASEQERLLTGLGRSEEKVRGESKKTLRTLEEDVRNQLKAAGQFIGSLGAGDSSAVGRASGAVTKAGLKQKGLALENLGEQVADIEARRIDVQQLAEQKLQEIEVAKQEQLFSLAQNFQGIQRQLESAKAQATSNERLQIAQQEQALRGDMQNRLNQLNDEVRAAQQATDVWNRQRQADIEDFGRRLASRGTFTGQGAFSAADARILEEFNRVADTSGVATAQRLAEQRGRGDLTGFITGTPSQVTEEDPFDALVNNAITEALGGTQAPSTLRSISNQALAP